MKNLSILEWLYLFVFLYPLGMSVIWSVSASFFAYRRERSKENPLPLRKTPLVSIIVPFFNEEALLKDTLLSLLAINYPRYEIVLINDGSTDDSPSIAREFAKRYEKIRLIEKSQNEGKADSINKGILASKGHILLFIDADAVVDRQILRWMIPHFTEYPRVGAVTGHPLVRNRTGLITRVQVVEYSSIISLIKRAQRIAGKVFTVSGVVFAIKRSALAQIGLFDHSMATEDIDISWRLQKNSWNIHFEPNATVWIIVPHNLMALFKQRLRWALGGLQVLIKHFDVLTRWRTRRMWPVYFDSLIAISWAFTFYTLAILWLIGLFSPMQAGISPLIHWYGSILAVMSLLQMMVSTALNYKYDKTMRHNFFWAAWYPVFFWLISSSAVIVALPILIFRRKQKDKISWQTARR